MDPEFQNLVTSLEHNANILLGSSTGAGTLPPSELRAAEAVFQEFRRRRNPFALCRQILATTRNSFVQHQTAACLKNAIIRDWNLLTNEARHELLSYLIATVNGAVSNGPEHVGSPLRGVGGGDMGAMANYVREELLLVAAVLLKRLACEDDQAILDSMLGSLCAALTDSACDLRHRLVAVSFLIAVLREYASSTRASDFGLPLKKHMRAKNYFEKNFLKRIFQATLTSLERSLGVLTTSESNQSLLAPVDTELKFLARIMEAMESILMWNFNILTIYSVNYARHLDALEVPSLSPPIDWKDIFLNPQLFTFFSRVFITLWTHPQLGKQVGEQTLHRTLQCISQCSSLSGSILANPNARLQYTQFMIHAMVSVGSYFEYPAHSTQVFLMGREWTCLANIINRIVMNLQCRDLIFKAEFQDLKSFLNVIGPLLCTMLKGSAMASTCEQSQLRTGLFSDDLSENVDSAKGAIDLMFDSWQSFVVSLETQEQNRIDELNGAVDEVDARPTTASAEQSTHTPVTLLSRLRVIDFTNDIFLTFLRIHLCAPDGLRPLNMVTLEADDEIDEDFEADDRQTYAEQLNVIGTLGRLDAPASVKILTDAFQSRLSQYHQLIQMCIQSNKRVDEMDPSSPEAGALRSSWMNINEDLHWLLLISANLLTQTTYDTRYQIPREIMNISIGAPHPSPSINSDAVLACDPNMATDPIVKLITCVFQLVSFEQGVLEAGRSDLLSPQTCFSVTTFVSRFAQGYLLPDETLYQSMSLVLSTCWGRDSPTGLNVLNNIILKLVVARLGHWSSELTLSQECADMLVNFVLWSPTRAVAVASCPLFSRFVGQDFASLPLATRKTLCHFMVSVGSSLGLKEDNQSRGEDNVTLSEDSLKKIDHILSGFLATFEKVHHKFSTNPQVIGTDEFRQELIGMYECIQGMALAVTPNNIPTVWIRYIKPLFLKFPQHLIHGPLRNSFNVVNALLETVRELADRVLVYLAREEQLPFYGTCMDLLVAYSSSRPVLSFDPSQIEEESYSDILVIIQLLQEIAQKEYIDWSPNEQQKDSTPAGTPLSVSPVEVVFRGLNMLRPLMSEELLKFPRLCEAYYKLIAFVCEDPEYAHITNGDHALLSMVILSCQLALNSAYTSEVKCHSLEIISVLSSHYARAPERYLAIGQAMAALLVDVWRFVITDCVHSTGDGQLKDQVASALFGLISLPLSETESPTEAQIHQMRSKCEAIICEILASLQQRQSTAAAISSSVMVHQFSQELTNSIIASARTLLQATDLTHTRNNKFTFKQHFETFIIELQGLICIK